MNLNYLLGMHITFATRGFTVETPHRYSAPSGDHVRSDAYCASYSSATFGALEKIAPTDVPKHSHSGGDNPRGAGLAALRAGASRDWDARVGGDRGRKNATKQTNLLKKASQRAKYLASQSAGGGGGGGGDDDGDHDHDDDGSEENAEISAEVESELSDSLSDDGARMTASSADSHALQNVGDMIKFSARDLSNYFLKYEFVNYSKKLASKNITNNTNKNEH